MDRQGAMHSVTLLMSAAAAALAASLFGGPARAEGKPGGVDALLDAEFDKITQRHKARVRAKGDTRGPTAGRLKAPGEPSRTLRTPVFVRKGSLRKTLHASLSGKHEVGVGPLYYAGPFDNDKDKGLRAVYPPEVRIDLNARFVGLADSRFGWKRWDRFREGRRRNGLDLGRRRQRVVGYVFRRLTTKRPTEVPILLDSRERMTVWLNGKMILGGDDERPKGRDSLAGKLWLKLTAGDNALLIKCCSGRQRIELAYGDFRSAPSDIEAMIMERAREGMTEADAQELHQFAIERAWLAFDRKVLAEKAGTQAAARKALQLAKDSLAFVGAPRPELSGELASLAKRFETAGEGTDWHQLYLDTRWLRRRIILSHPLLGFEELLINKRTPPGYSHMCDQYLGRHSGAGDGLVVLKSWRDRPEARRLLPDLPVGTTHYPDLSHDAKRVLFSFCDHTERDRSKRRFWIYEATMDPSAPLGAGGQTVRQITGVEGRDPMEGQDGRKTVLIEDWDPCYLPDGDIVFISTRNQAYGRCHGGRYTPAYVLYRCGLNGENIRRISWGEANEWDPAVLHDGRIVYTRWDYINRHDTFYQSLWTTHPDGSGTAHFYGNNTRNPCMIAEARAIPGSHRVVATAMAHHSYTSGSMIVIDPLKGLDGLEPIRRITPEARFPEGEGGTLGPYCTPWPLSEDLFLAAHTPDRLAFQGGRQRDNAYGIYLVDSLGGRELIYRDPTISCFSPIPIQPRPKPPALSSALDPRAKEGVFFLHNVYASGDLGVKPIGPGTAKYLRVVGIIEQPAASAPIRSIANNEIVKGILGTVPLDESGSVAFRAPANEPLLFQVLDKNHMSIMSMRSQAYLQPGERMSCVGCHEPLGRTSGIHRRKPLEIRRLNPPPGPQYADGFSFARTVQPVLDRYCIRCHGLGGTSARPGGGAAAELRGGRASAKVSKMSLLGTHSGRFCQAYDSLTKRGGIRLAQRNGEAVPSRPKDYGAHASKLATMLLAGHKGRVRLDTESFRRIAGWLDLNVQYYGDYVLRNRPERRKPDAAGEKALRAHLQSRCASCHASQPGIASHPFAALVNTACPDESRVLKAMLPVAEGGWGQCKSAFRKASDEGFQVLREKVLAATKAPEKGRNR